jgi:uncharacterized membrane protein YeaQ/YmgE (transglycosylase-associated protein family)
MVEIIGVITTTGIIIGFVGKFVAPGSRARTPMCHHFCGIGGVLIGWFICSAFGCPGIDWVRWLIAIAVATVLVVIASTLTGRNTLGSGDDPPSLKIVRV